jgi:hypothetical protein
MNAFDLDATIALISIPAQTWTVYSYPNGMKTAANSVSVPALTIKSLFEIPQEVFARDCPILFPSPQNWLGQSSSTPQQFDNVVAGRLTFEHTLTYILAYAQEGEGRGLSDHYAGMAALIQLLVPKLSRLDLTAMSIRRVAVTAFGQITDPAGKGFYGCGITVTALEFIP